MREALTSASVVSWMSVSPPARSHRTTTTTASATASSARPHSAILRGASARPRRGTRADGGDAGQARPVPALADCARVRRAATPLILTAATALAACGGDQPQDRRFGTFTDCASVGHVTGAGDPRGDQRGLPEGGAEQPQGDLVAVRLARGGGRLCVEWRAAAAIRAPTAYALALRPPRAGGPVVQLEVSVLAGESPGAVLRAPGATAGREI